MELMKIIDEHPEGEKAFMTSLEGAPVFAELMFYMFDKNGDNVLDKEEFAGCFLMYNKLRNKGWTEDDFTRIF